MSNMDRPETMQQSLGRILLADDDDLFREALATRLRRDGYECVCAASAQEALEHLRATEFDTLISDIYMPGNVGLELIEQVPQVAAGLPVVLMTGRPSVETAVKSVNLSVVGYLTKPVELEPMRALLRRSVESFRCYRNVTGSRERLEAWAKNLARIERSLRDPATPDKAAPVAQYLQLMAANLMSTLGDLRASLALFSIPGQPGHDLEQQELVEALERTIGVLEQTKQNFKSKKLGELRRELEVLLENRQPAAGAPEAPPPAAPAA